jgi:hypothetical protein
MLRGRRKLEEVGRLFQTDFPHGVVWVFVGINEKLWMIKRLVVFLLVDLFCF